MVESLTPLVAKIICFLLPLKLGHPAGSLRRFNTRKKWKEGHGCGTMIGTTSRWYAHSRSLQSESLIVCRTNKLKCKQVYNSKSQFVSSEHLYQL